MWRLVEHVGWFQLNNNKLVRSYKMAYFRKEYSVEVVSEIWKCFHSKTTINFLCKFSSRHRDKIKRKRKIEWSLIIASPPQNKGYARTMYMHLYARLWATSLHFLVCIMVSQRYYPSPPTSPLKQIQQKWASRHQSHSYPQVTYPVFWKNYQPKEENGHQPRSLGKVFDTKHRILWAFDTK